MVWALELAGEGAVFESHITTVESEAMASSAEARAVAEGAALGKMVQDLSRATDQAIQSLLKRTKDKVSLPALTQAVSVLMDLASKIKALMPMSPDEERAREQTAAFMGELAAIRDKMYRAGWRLLLLPPHLRPLNAEELTRALASLPPPPGWVPEKHEVERVIGPLPSTAQDT